MTDKTEAPKRGRPPLPDNKQHTSTMQTLFTGAEARAVKAALRRSKLRFATWSRGVLLEAARRLP